MIDLIKKYKYENMHGIMQYVYKQIDKLIEQKIESGKLDTKFDYSKPQFYFINETIKFPKEIIIHDSLANKIYFEKTYYLYKYEKCAIINGHTVYINTNKFNRFKYSDNNIMLIDGIYGIILIISPTSIYDYNI